MSSVLDIPDLPTKNGKFDLARYRQTMWEEQHLQSRRIKHIEGDNVKQDKRIDDIETDVKTAKIWCKV